MTQTLDIFKALSDEIRLRIIRALAAAELSVAELVGVLGLPQSTVSRHLKPLRDTDLVETRREGTSIYYRWGSAFEDPGLSKFLEDRLGELPGAQEDKASVRRMLDLRRQRSREFFDKIAGQYSTLTEPGGGWQALAAGLTAGFSGRQVVDLGAGEGVLSLMLARAGAHVTAVDHSPKMLRLVEEQATEAGVAARVSVAEGDLESLPLADEAFDVAFLSQTLHHAAKPDAAVKEAARVLKSGGRLVLLDLVKHEQEWVRDEWADLWLGFEEKDVRGWLEEAGLDIVSYDRLGGSTPELSVFIVIAQKN